MKNSTLITRVVLATVALALLSVLAEIVVERKFSLIGLSGWLLAGSLMITVALSATVLGARRGGWAVVASVFFLYFAVRYFNTAVELRIFQIGVQPHFIRNEALRGLITSLLFAPILVWLLGRWNAADESPAPAPRSVWGWIWRIVAGDVAYFVFYMVAGMIIFPYVKQFYANVPMPAPGAFLFTQAIRGLVYVIAGLGVTRLMNGKPGRAALALALAFPVLAGLEPLLYPNDIMPGNIRLPHAIEIGWSNAAYGALLGLMLTRRAMAKATPAVKPVASPQAA
jgi:hypothetical protein